MKQKIRISIDTETGGTNPLDFDCLSIGYVVVKGSNLKILEKNEILIKGKRSRCTSQALSVNKIDLKEHNKKALTKKQAVCKFQKVIEKYFDDDKIYIVGQNVSFDISFISKLFSDVNKTFVYSHSIVDLMYCWRCLQLIGIVKTKSAGLDEILDYCKIRSNGARHSAIIDAENVVKVLRFLKKRFLKF